MLSPLPIDDVLPELIAALRARSAVVLRAPTGAGKTTRVPPAVLDAGIIGEGRILVLQPRRLAARTAARRMAFERQVRLGGEVGYQVRFDEQVSRETRINVVTEGILLRMLQDDPFLERVAAVVFDEFHERNLNSDLALGMVRRIQQTVRPELKIVVMSATLAPGPISEYLGGCPVVESEGRTFPVQIRYLPKPDARPLHLLTAAGVEDALVRTDGDVLVFLPGIGEIRRAGRELEPLARRHGLAVMELYGDLPAEQQDRVLMPIEQRKVVLSTNVAETSVTVEGITAVVDTGVARILRFDPRLGLDRLDVLPISRASADQRAGRAGRTQPGLCLRMWDERSHQRRPERELPEIQRVDLAGAVLQLLSWGERDVLAFPWFEPPAGSAVEQALGLLDTLDLLDGPKPNRLGQLVARLPVHPRIGRLLAEGDRLRVPERIALLGALLSERDPFHRGGGADSSAPRGGRSPIRTVAIHRSRSDVLDRLSALEEFEQQGRRESEQGSVNVGAAQFLFRARSQLLGSLRQDLGPRERSTVDSDTAVLQSLLAAYPDRLARRRDAGSERGVMVGGRGVRLAPQSAVRDAELFLCIDVDAGSTDAIVRQASAVERAWLPESHVRIADELFFHPTRKQVEARRRTYWIDLVIEESTAPVPEGAEVLRVLSEAARAHWERVFPADEPNVASFLARVRCLGEWRPELNLPAFDRAQLDEVLGTLCQGRRSFDELRNAPWLDHLKGLLSYEQLQAVEREAPERLQVPSGSRIALQYEVGRPPVLPVRIQEVFGLAETPRVAGGHIPVLLHLLAPNMRPQQVTDDLRSFWANTYPLVRKELRARYPKHAWPEDPWNAPAQRKPGR